MRLDGKVALITGAGSGIGQAATHLFAAAGAAVVAADIDGSAAERTVATVKGDALAVRCDVAADADVAAAVAAAERQFGGLDILYSNAGLYLTDDAGYIEGVTDAPSPLLTEDVWQRVLDVNLKSVYLGARHAIPAMRRRGGGAIVNTASIAGYRVGSGASDAYTAAKGAVVAITRSLAVEHAGDGIRVNCVVPGPITTPMTDAMPADRHAAFAELVPLGRFGRPEEVAAMALFLCSDSSSYCTGQAYVVDGGFLAR